MNRYESIIITKPTITEEEKISILKNVEEIVGVTEVIDIGIKKLAYEVKKHKEGYYIEFCINAEKEQITELEKYYRMEDLILKFMNVREE